MSLVDTLAHKREGQIVVGLIELALLGCGLLALGRRLNRPTPQ